MPNPSTATAAGAKIKSVSRTQPEYPVREYIGSLAQELAQMARWDNDEVLAELLDAAADRANETRSA